MDATADRQPRTVNETMSTHHLVTGTLHNTPLRLYPMYLDEGVHLISRIGLGSDGGAFR